MVYICLMRICSAKFLLLEEYTTYMNYASPLSLGKQTSFLFKFYRYLYLMTIVITNKKCSSGYFCHQGNVQERARDNALLSILPRWVEQDFICRLQRKLPRSAIHELVYCIPVRLFSLYVQCCNAAHPLHSLNEVLDNVRVILLFHVCGLLSSF